MKRILLALALASAPAIALAQDKPLVAESHVIKTLPANTTLQLNAPGAGNASINLPHGTAPTSPNNGDCWTTTGGFYCRINGSTVGPFGTGGGTPGGSSGQLQYNNSGAFGGVVLGANLSFSGGVLSASGGGGGTSGAAIPQGRLSCTSGAAVMTANVSACTTVYYECYVGALYPNYSGSADVAITIGSCQTSTALQSSGTGVLNNNDVFDVWGLASGAICVATNGSGGGWSSDTGGSLTARGTGYSQVHNTRGFWTNANSITHCYNGSSDLGSVSADHGTYLGSLYTTAAGATAFVFKPSIAAGGTLSVLGLYNAYNRVKLLALERDGSTSGTRSWGYMSQTWRQADASANNEIVWVDGLQQSWVDARYQILEGSTGLCNTGVDLDSTSTQPGSVAQENTSGGNTATAIENFPPQIGKHYIAAVEIAPGGCTLYGSASNASVISQYYALELAIED